MSGAEYRQYRHVGRSARDVHRSPLAVASVSSTVVQGLLVSGRWSRRQSEEAKRAQRVFPLGLTSYVLGARVNNNVWLNFWNKMSNLKTI